LLPERVQPGQAAPAAPIKFLYLFRNCVVPSAQLTPDLLARIAFLLPYGYTVP